MITLVKNVFIDIHYKSDERKQADQLAHSYESRGYSRESDEEDCIQLLTTKTRDIYWDKERKE